MILIISERNKQDRDSTEVTSRLGSIDRRYNELLELANIRKQRLLDALALYQLYNESDNVEQWITEKVVSVCILIMFVL